MTILSSSELHFAASAETTLDQRQRRAVQDLYDDSHLPQLKAPAPSVSQLNLKNVNPAGSRALSQRAISSMDLARGTARSDGRLKMLLSTQRPSARPMLKERRSRLGPGGVREWEEDMEDGR